MGPLASCPFVFSSPDLRLNAQRKKVGTVEAQSDTFIVDRRRGAPKSASVFTSFVSGM